MADAKISALPSVTSPTTSDQLAIVQSGTTSKITVGDFYGGITGSFTLYGDTASGGALTLSSTAHATKGKIIVGSVVIDEANTRIGIGTTSPSQPLTIEKSGTVNFFMKDTSEGADAKTWAWQVAASHLTAYAVTDAGVVGTNAFRLQRTGSTITDMIFGPPAGILTLRANASAGRVNIQVEESDPLAGSLQNGTMVFFYSSAGPTIEVRHKTAAGASTTGTVATLV